MKAGDRRIRPWTLHPGTGYNDHGPHSWEMVSHPDDPTIVFRACQVCGWPHPDDVTMEVEQ